jgi:hypothetical protein
MIAALWGGGGGVQAGGVVVAGKAVKAPQSAGAEGVAELKDIMRCKRARTKLRSRSEHKKKAVSTCKVETKKLMAAVSNCTRASARRVALSKVGYMDKVLLYCSAGRGSDAHAAHDVDGHVLGRRETEK